MSKTLYALAALVGIVVGFGAGWLAHQAPAPQPNLGATIGYQTSQGSQQLYNGLASLLQDVQNLHPTASTTAVIAFPTLSATSTATTTQVSGLAAQIGDLVLIEPTGNATSAPIGFTAQVSVASTTSATFEIIANPATTTAFIPATSSFNLWVLPKATFGNALNTATSTTSF